MTGERLAEEIKIYQGISRICFIIADIWEHESNAQLDIRARKKQEYIKKAQISREKAHKRYLEYVSVYFPDK